MVRSAGTSGTRRRGARRVSPWTEGDLVAAVDALGWAGTVGQLAEFHGTRFVPVVDPEMSPSSPGSGWLIGCLVTGMDAAVTMREASVLAPYSRRAVLLPTGCDPADMALRASILDQGVVVADEEEFRLISEPGPVADSPLQDTTRWRTDRRWSEFLEAVQQAVSSTMLF